MWNTKEAWCLPRKVVLGGRLTWVACDYLTRLPDIKCNKLVFGYCSFLLFENSYISIDYHKKVTYKKKNYHKKG